MRKAFTISGIVLASSMALGVTGTAFAADAPHPTPTSSASTGTDGGAKTGTTDASLKLSASTAKPGASVEIGVTAPEGSTSLSVSSAALGDVKLTEGKSGTTWTGTAKVADVKDGNYGVALTGSAPGGKVRATAQLTVKAGAPDPKPQSPTLRLSKDFGRPGDKVAVTVTTGAGDKSAQVKSAAFAGGQVNLTSDGKGTWTGTAVVANDVKTGYYGVDAFAGGKKFDTVKFSTEASGHDEKPDVKPVTPLKPSEHKKPKGSVNTGQAPLAATGTDAGTVQDATRNG
ncbi:hypothetical protein OHA84_20535 [Streptomyces sp. NBC_00513]|uniref:hypothetical protein n=1 Tax=unclassified Streptomyces TaxID=2593676 RepID=UPI002259E729|nr:hypothetical protein [Streptomyces sp. NBC_00424]MCX5074100.1 hypothetical protein [Streptomyces sp. NBC_00424]WUD42695.1 hypothetical protein OHA84_20535 [Streptomyces sp. NBC_00513]